MESQNLQKSVLNQPVLIPHSLDLSEPLDTEHVDGKDKDDEDDTPDGTVDGCVPVSDDQGAGNDLVRADNEVLRNPSAHVPQRLKTSRIAHFAEVDQSRGETESGVDASRSVTGETLLGGVSSGHLSQGQHDTEA